MNIYKKILLFYIVSLLFFTLTMPGYAQQRTELYRLYEQSEFTALEQAVKKVGTISANDYEGLFFKTLFIKDGERAEQNYLSVFEHGTPRLRLLAAKKLMDYFYAAGYYMTSEKYQKYIVEHAMPVVKAGTAQTARQATTPRYFIQVGAFGLPANARQRVSFLKTQDVNAQLVERVVNGKTLYCVWIEGKMDLDKSLEFANKIKQKFDLEFQIMKK